MSFARKQVLVNMDKATRAMLDAVKERLGRLPNPYHKSRYPSSWSRTQVINLGLDLILNLIAEEGDEALLEFAAISRVLYNRRCMDWDAIRRVEPLRMRVHQLEGFWSRRIDSILKELEP